ncbi:hypothetical protein AC578_1717 [Pseudocercospora eumusae]|uniref:DUF6594 domain-containing protein n=1 Tax=Pseudocercospora eumusae TaxID=321146 RepID=A0A139GWB6_9PEZI|nr:hypothetical protein AC578_1717 [Pseudocercospora eumusae]
MALGLRKDDLEARAGAQVFSTSQGSSESSKNLRQPEERSSAATSGRDGRPPDLKKSVDEQQNEDVNLYLFAEELYDEGPTPAEPWFLEMTRLRRAYILHLSKRLAKHRKRFFEERQATDRDMEDLGKTLHEQANAIRDLQLLRSLDFLPPKQRDQRHERTIGYFPETARSKFPDIHPFASENYRCLAPQQGVVLDEVREFLRAFLPAKLSWTNEEKQARAEFYHATDTKYKPQKLSATADRLARFIVAMSGALFILVPMYIMVLHKSQTTNLVATTVAVLLFAVMCSITMRATNDQTLGATAAYAAVLVVFVGLTS